MAEQYVQGLTSSDMPRDVPESDTPVQPPPRAAETVGYSSTALSFHRPVEKETEAEPAEERPRVWDRQSYEREREEDQTASWEEPVEPPPADDGFYTYGTEPAQPEFDADAPFSPELTMARSRSRQRARRRRRRVQLALAAVLLAVILLKVAGPVLPDLVQATADAAALSALLSYPWDEDGAVTPVLNGDAGLGGLSAPVAAAPSGDPAADQLRRQQAALAGVLGSGNGAALPDDASNGGGDEDQTVAQAGLARPENAGKVLERNFSGTFSAPTYLRFGSGYIKNNTEVDAAEISEILQSAPTISPALDGSIEVLLISTHATEAYEPADVGYYDKSYNSRSTDNNTNVVAVAARIAEKLREAGIGVIHDTQQYDYPSYNGAYDRSGEAIRQYLAEYPTIKVVLDVHRDAIENADGDRVKPVVEIDGRKAAQIMLIAGCDDGTMDMPNWPENLRFGAQLQNACEFLYPGLTRPMGLSYRRYNQALCTGSVLVEFGGHANTLEEAQYAGELFANALVQMLRGCAE